MYFGNTGPGTAYLVNDISTSSNQCGPPSALVKESIVILRFMSRRALLDFSSVWILQLSRCGS